MPLTLITGPANAGKAELVFDGLRAELRREGTPWLVVPSSADVRHYREELARTGVVMGARVARFSDLSDEIARRAALSSTRVDELARERVLAALVAAAEGSPPERGYARELGRLVGELERLHITPARMRRALSAWERSDRPTSAHARNVGALLAGYQQLLSRLGCTDADLLAANALDELRRAPARWSEAGAGRTAVFFYGFDDLTVLQLDAIETLARLVDAPVTVALTFEAGRVAFAERAAAFQTLLPWARKHVVVAPATRYYAETSQAALGHLERRLFEPSGERSTRVRVDSAGAVKLLEGGGERAELELVARGIRALLDDGTEPHEIALVHRSPQSLAPLLADVLGEHGVPFALAGAGRFEQSALGRGLLALLRCALLDADAQELLRWLRTPGVVERQEFVDELELRLAREGVRSATAAQSLWEETRWPLSAFERLQSAAAEGTLALIDCVQRELAGLFCKPRKGAARELSEEERREAEAFRCANESLSQLRDIAARSPESMLTEPTELVALLEELGLEDARETRTGAVSILGPLELRARRVRALFLCGLQERVFPAPAAAPPFLGEQERRSLAEGAGLVLERQADWLARERYLFYACVSRPEELLVLSWHAADDDGNPTPRSLFVDDVCDLFDDRLFGERERRALGTTDALMSEDGVGVVAEGIAGLRDERLLEELRTERLWSASSLGAYACCPVRWLVEQLLAPERLEPESEPLASGRVIHAVLTDVLEALRSATGSARLGPEQLDTARALMREAIARRCEQERLSVIPEQQAALRRRLEADLGRYLEHAADQEGSMEPSYLERSFGFEGDELGALELGGGVRVRGRIDRVDVDADGHAVVYDYKRSGGRGAPPGEKWLTRRSVQVAIYMRAVRDLLGLEVAGGFYQPVTGEDLRARGAIAQGTDAPAMRGDRYEPEEFDALVEETLALAREAAAQARSGRLEARPQTCSASGKGCLYPSICRCEP